MVMRLIIMKMHSHSFMPKGGKQQNTKQNIPLQTLWLDFRLVWLEIVFETFYFHIID